MVWQPISYHIERSLFLDDQAAAEGLVPELVRRLQLVVEMKRVW